MLASYKSCKVVIRDNAKFLPIASINEDFFFLHTPFPASSRVPLLPKARSRVRAASAQRQAARPIWVGQV